jgi:hypothetical protein
MKLRLKRDINKLDQNNFEYIILTWFYLVNTLESDEFLPVILFGEYSGPKQVFEKRTDQTKRFRVDILRLCLIWFDLKPIILSAVWTEKQSNYEYSISTIIISVKFNLASTLLLLMVPRMNVAGWRRSFWATTTWDGLQRRRFLGFRVHDYWAAAVIPEGGIGCVWWEGVADGNKMIAICIYHQLKVISLFATFFIYVLSDYHVKTVPYL